MVLWHFDELLHNYILFLYVFFKEWNNINPCIYWCKWFYIFILFKWPTIWHPWEEGMGLYFFWKNKVTFSEKNDFDCQWKNEMDFDGMWKQKLIHYWADIYTYSKCEILCEVWKIFFDLLRSRNLFLICCEAEKIE